MYLGCLHQKRNVSEVSELFYPEKQNSVRSAISRKDSVNELVNSGYLAKKKNGSWKYLSKKDKLGEFVISMLEENYARDPAPRIDREHFSDVNELFQVEEVNELLKPEKVQKVMNDTFSDSKRRISFFIKWLFMFLMLSKYKQENISDEEMNRMENELEEFREDIEETFNDLSEGLELFPQEQDIMSIQDYILETEKVMEIIDQSGIDEEVIRDLPYIEVPEVERFYDTLERIGDEENEFTNSSE